MKKFMNDRLPEMIIIYIYLKKLLTKREHYLYIKIKRINRLYVYKMLDM